MGLAEMTNSNTKEAAVLDTVTPTISQTDNDKAERFERIKTQLTAKFTNESQKQLVEYLYDRFRIMLWLNEREGEITWLQQVNGREHVVIGKTRLATFSEDVGEFYEAYEVMSVKGIISPERVMVEVKSVEVESGTEIVFDCLLSNIKAECKKKAIKWKALGYGTGESIQISEIKIIDTIPF